MSLIIRTDGSTEVADPANGRNFELEELQKIVAGRIEILYLAAPYIMVLNKEGMEVLPINRLATQRAFGYIIEGTAIYGDVLVCHTKLVK